MRVGLAFDLAPPAAARGDGPDDRFEEFDRPETVAAIADAIRGDGHEVTLLGDGREFLARVLADPPDFVFNIAEGEGVGRCREARVPAVLELLGIPYSGSDPLTLAASLDKDVARMLCAVKCPAGLLVATPPPNLQLAHAHLAPYLIQVLGTIPGTGLEPDFGHGPVILKPAYEGSSKGIRDGGLARSLDEAVALYAELHATYAQPILIEEFIAGDEVTVGIVGNCSWGEPPTWAGLIGMMRIAPRQPTDAFVYSLDVKRDWRNRVAYQAPAQLDPAIRDRLAEAAMTAYRSLGCRDLARIDFRVRDGIPYFIEANPLPGLAPVSSDLVILAEGHGISHADLIRRILHAALDRVGLR